MIEAAALEASCCRSSVFNGDPSVNSDRLNLSFSISFWKSVLAAVMKPLDAAAVAELPERWNTGNWHIHFRISRPSAAADVNASSEMAVLSACRASSVRDWSFWKCRRLYVESHASLRPKSADLFGNRYKHLWLLTAAFNLLMYGRWTAACKTPPSRVMLCWRTGSTEIILCSNWLMKQLRFQYTRNSWPDCESFSPPSICFRLMPLPVIAE